MGCKTTSTYSEKAPNEQLVIKSDTTLYGSYLFRRPLSGVYLTLKSDGSFIKNYFCDICPKYMIKGVFLVKMDTIFLRDTALIAEKSNWNGIEEYSYWYRGNSLDSISTYKMFRWSIDSLNLIGFEKQNDSITKRVKFILGLQDNWIKMDELPFRKIYN